ncbi:hypothetical protein DH2020_014890 [Rehmannia glutinosa]|uniref:SMAX1-like nucleotide binding domain-containing protein n=1 Tax=Rehmannia glutinosa TaxID=99300 RepID=A0ABR0WYE9_REHGL
MLSASSGLFRAACLESHSHPLQCKALELCFNSSSSNQNEDVRIVIENLLKKRKSIVLVGENISSLESTVKCLMDMVDNTEINIPEALRGLKFVTIPPLYSFCNLRREEVEQKIGELTCLVKGLLGKGVVLYFGDFKWISDYRVSLEEERRYYCSVEHVIMEIGRLVWGIGEIERFWLMGIATFQTYMRCRNGYHSLESVWGLHPVTIPANSLGFSLVSDQSDEQSVARRERVENPSSNQLLLTNGEIKLSCCTECSAKFEAEAQNLKTNFCNSTNGPTLSSLPSWLKDESKRLISNKNQGYDDAIKELCNKWNSFCSSSSHKRPLSIKETLNFSSTSCFPFDQNSTRINFPLPGPSYGNSIKAFSSHNSASSSDEITEMEYMQKFKEFNAENLNILCNALEKNVPWQRDIIPEIAGTILQCRSGMLRRKNKPRGNIINSDDVKQDTWLLFVGPNDGAHAKEKICKELAKVVFGSYSNFVSIGLNGLNNLVSSDDCKSYIERFAKAVSANPHRVFLLEDFEKVDYCSRMGIKRAIERGRIRNESTGEEYGFCDAIIVLSYERFSLSTSSRACSPSSKGKTENYRVGEDETRGHCVSLDLNISFDGDAVDAVDHDQAVDDFGIFENVDRRVIFKFQEDL